MRQPSETPPTESQEVFGPYLVHERVGVGGMATVHRAKERGIEGFERIVALKRLLPHLAEDASFVKAFVREAKLASLLQHANIVQLFELGRVGSTYFISMEYIDGRDIRQLLRQARRVSGPPTINVTVALLIQMCDALEYAHTRIDDHGEALGLVHRDVSPSNLLVTRSGHLKVIDFGIAKAQSSQLRTQTGRVKGKLAYMAPEAIAGKDLDARSDIFSVGVIAHELLTARPLFASKNEYQTIVNVQKAELLPPSAFNQAVPPELDHVVLRALARDRDQRYESAAQMRDDLHGIRSRYQLSATNREVQTWIEWAFALDSPGGSFSGQTDFGTMASKSPTMPPGGNGPHTPLPLRAPPETARAPIASPRPSPIASLAAAAMPGPRSRASEEDDAADVAWGGGKDQDSGAPVVLDDVPDHSHRRPGYAAATAMAEADLDDAPTPLPPPSIADLRAAADVAPDAWPQGSSADAVPGKTRSSQRFASIVTGNPVSVAAAAVEPMPAPVAAPVPIAPTVGFGDAIVSRRSTSSRPTGWIIGGLALAAAASVAVYLATKPTASTSTGPVVVAAPPATLKFIIEPGDATIKIAGMEPHVGAPWSIQLDPGVAQVKVSRDGHLSWETSIELSSNETQTVRVVLGPAPAGLDASQASLELSSDPGGLAVLLDGHDIGKRTPVTMPIPPGAHTVSLRQYGDIVWRHTFDAEAGTLYQFNPSMDDAKVAERAARERQPARDHERALSTSPTPSELLAARPPIGAGSAMPRPIGPGPGSTAGSAAIGTGLAPFAPGAGSAAIGTGVVGAGAVAAVTPPKPITPGAGSAVMQPITPGAGSAAALNAATGAPGPGGPRPPTGPAITQPAIGSGSAAIAPPPPPPPAATTVTPVIPPNAVKRVSGSLAQIYTINRTGEDLPRSASAKICIDRSGAVTSVAILKITGDIATKLTDSIRTWRYTPYVVDGQASGACFVNSFTLR